VNFPSISAARRIERLTPPDGPVRMVLDTDTYNEIDDQFAIAHALLSPDRLRVEAIYAAPFHNRRAASPADGMEKSYQEILLILDRLGRSDRAFACRGAKAWLTAEDRPQPSDAAADLVARALASDEDDPLYVVAIGAITNVASAMLQNPGIIERIVVVWLGGQPGSWHTTREFNLQGDMKAARVVLNSGVPLVQIPCKNVAEHLTTTKAELQAHIAGRNPLCDFLYETFCGYSEDHFAWAKEIWDVSAIAWLLNADWVPSVLTPTPILTDQVTWSHDRTRHLMREATHCRRNPIFRDLFAKLANA
jgi:purine nucleosidase